MWQFVGVVEAISSEPGPVRISLAIYRNSDIAMRNCDKTII
jgi:hypothetical protein